MISVIGLFEEYIDAEQAVSKLRDRSFDKRQISLVAKRRVIHDQLTTYDRRIPQNRARGAIRGAALGGILGLLVGVGAVMIPAIGSTIIVGLLATAIGTTMEGLRDALGTLGVSPKKARILQEQVRDNQILLAVHTAEGAETAAQILNAAGATHVYSAEIHDPGDLNARLQTSLEKIASLETRQQLTPS